MVLFPMVFPYGRLLACVALLAAACGPPADTPADTAGAPETPIRFTDVTEAAGLADAYHVNGAAGKKYYPEMMGSGAAFFDYDGDGWADILFLGGGRWAEDPGRTPQSVWLYRNNQEGAFTDVTAEAGLDVVTAYTIGPLAGDVDNDGDPDLFITTLGRNLLLLNEGGRFTDVTAEAGLDGEAVWSSSALFFDADRDGDLDLYVANYVDWSPETDKWCPEGSDVKLYCLPADYTGIPSRFYLNEGPREPGGVPRFTDRTAEAGFLPAPGKSLGIVEMDYNRDGWPDLAVANDGEGDLLYENNGASGPGLSRAESRDPGRPPTFTERGVQSGLAFSEHGEARAGMGIDAGDVDGSGEPTVFIGHFSQETSGVYRHRGNGLFLDRSSASGVGHPSLPRLTFGLFLFDVELDGDLDLFAANGHVQPDRLAGGEGHITFRQPAQLFVNDGTGQFSEFREEGGVWSEPLVARAAAYADIDRDGDLDVLLTENDGGMRLWRNDGATGNALRIRLTGTESNRDALGARIEVVADGLRQTRRIRTATSYLSQMERVATFGLGAAERVDSLIVAWPSGRVDRFADVAAGQELHLLEGDDLWHALPLPVRGTGTD